MNKSIIKKTFLEEALPNLLKDLNLKSSMAVPRITKVSLNMGLGADAINDRKVLEGVMEELKLISGQQPVKTTARKSVASFKLREGFALGCKVTLRGERMYEFLDRLLSIASPRERDFRGLDPRSFDGRGNYTIGIKEHIIFPEVNFDKVDKIRGLDITIVIKSQKVEHSFELLKHLNFPFRETRSN